MNNMTNQAELLGKNLVYLLKEQGIPVDHNQLYSGIENIRLIEKPYEQLIILLQYLGIYEQPEVFSTLDSAYMPLLGLHSTYGWGCIVQQVSPIQWLFQQEEKIYDCHNDEFTLIVKIKINQALLCNKDKKFGQILKENIKLYNGIMLEFIIASFIINFLALGTSLFSMQVYDRVIPTQNHYTLIILSTGVILAILFEMLMKFARSRVMDNMIVGLDQTISREIFEKLLRIRVDQMPSSVGSLAAQLRGYEQIRNFFTASTLFTLVDIPMSVLFIIIIAVIGSPWLMLVPILAILVGIWLGIINRKKMEKAATDGAAISYAKTGILVETVEGIETVKAGAGNWKFLSRWLNIMSETIENDLKIKHLQDNLNYSVQMIQQLSYISIVIIGSYIVMNNEMTMGGLIACTILGGRVLTPIMAIPQILIQYSHAKSAKESIDNLFKIKSDNHNIHHPLVPSKLYGHYEFSDVVFKYNGSEHSALHIPKLKIRAGERVAILGKIGSGKSTFLKLLSGLYATTEGHILIDGLDINHIARETISNQIGYLQQDHRLFQGTLRENLLIGMPTPPDDVLQKVLWRTGLIQLVSKHSKGLDLPIYEGGKGLSGGQKQLVAFSRLVLTNPNILLLDEPTASMDELQEHQCLHVLAQELRNSQKTLILSTHKLSLLGLVDRIIVVANNQVVMDGAKELVLKQLQLQAKENLTK